MLTETISGKCPCCEYDKMIQRYGSLGNFILDFCPRCGFAYGTNHHDGEFFHEEAWTQYGKYFLGMYGIEIDEGIDTLSLRKLIFDMVDKDNRCDDIDATIFVYSEEDITKYKATNPIIFNL